ncbi:hypothetical protein M514_05612, partial [Trichuris suis]
EYGLNDAYKYVRIAFDLKDSLILRRYSSLTAHSAKSDVKLFKVNPLAADCMAVGDHGQRHSNWQNLEKLRKNMRMKPNPGSEKPSWVQSRFVPVSEFQLSCAYASLIRCSDSDPVKDPGYLSYANNDPVEITAGPRLSATRSRTTHRFATSTTLVLSKRSCDFFLISVTILVSMRANKSGFQYELGNYLLFQFALLQKCYLHDHVENKIMNKRSAS